MLTGAPPPTASEGRLRRLGIQVLATRRLGITPAFWRFDLCSSFWRLYLHNRPGAHLTWAGGRLDIPAGRICLVPAHLRFTTATSVELLQDHIHAEVLGIPKVLQERIFDAPFLLRQDPVLRALSGRWRSRLRTMHQARGGPFDQPVAAAPGVGPDLVDFAWASALAEAALATAYEGLPESRSAICRAWLAATEELRQVLDVIDRRLADPPSNHELAGLCHLSTNQFIRRFRASLGVTPAHYILDRRLEAASRLLCRSDARIEGVAEMTGFFDRAHFVRAFRQRFGQSPVAYRRSHLTDPA